MHFGFSYVGLVMLLMLFAPNLLWAKNKPRDYEKYVDNENKVLRGLERAGQVGVTALCLVFSDFNMGTPSVWSLWLLAAAVLMVLYEVFWMGYFRSERTMGDFYRTRFGIPLPGAVLPVVAFFLLAVYGKNLFLGIAVVVLGIGHIGIHLGHRREIGNG